MENVVISVIMSVYNTKEEWLRESIDSILNQSFRNFELIIILDKPTDNSEIIVKEMAISDPRIRIIENKSNQGITKNLHKAVLLSKGKYIARMDSDDIADKSRFEKQVHYLDTHPNTVVLGTKALAFGEGVNDRIIGSQLTGKKEIDKTKLLFFNAGIVHPTAMIRKDFLTENKINYDLEMKKSQDYGLWVDVYESGGMVEEMPDALLKYRIHKNQITIKSSDEQKKSLKYRMEKSLSALGIDCSEEVLEIHYSLYHFSAGYSFSEYDNYISLLLSQNKKSGIYDQHSLLKTISKIWFHDICFAVIKKHKLNYLRSKYLMCAIKYGL